MNDFFLHKQLVIEIVFVRMTKLLVSINIGRGRGGIVHPISIIIVQVKVNSERKIFEDSFGLLKNKSFPFYSIIVSSLIIIYLV